MQTTTIKTESQIYQAARDVNGTSHCYIASYTPGQRITIVFPGYPEAFRDNMGAFINNYCETRRLNPDHANQTLTVFFEEPRFRQFLGQEVR